MRTTAFSMPIFPKPHNGKNTDANSNFANALYGKMAYANSNKADAADSNPEDVNNKLINAHSVSLCMQTAMVGMPQQQSFGCEQQMTRCSPESKLFGNFCHVNNNTVYAATANTYMRTATYPMLKRQ